MSDAMNDIFGDVPGRPDHPDFWKLSEIVLAMDGLSERPTGFDEALAAAHVDGACLVYVARQRAMRAATTPQEMMIGAAAWMDGFIAGTRYQEQ